jgi:iron complex outermembrane receptor protein
LEPDPDNAGGGNGAQPAFKRLSYQGFDFWPHPFTRVAAIFLFKPYHEVAMKLLLSLLLLVGAAASAFSANLRGTVLNSVNGVAVSDVKLTIIDLNRTTATDAKGRYSITEIPPGRYVMEAVHNAYNPYRFELTVAAEDRTIRRDIELKPAVAGQTTAQFMSQQPKYILDDVTITTSRASSTHPVTYSNITRSEVDRGSYGQDIPLLFSEQPNLYSYSDGGNGFGYSYIKMRGFSQNRIGVQLNGVPLNDAESHEVFWIDLPDFAEDVQDVQIQRGIGSSLYGGAALGGSINLVTKTPGLGDAPRIRAEAMTGSWNTRRAAVKFESGRINGRYGIAGRFTRMESDGYRYGSWLKTWSYYLAASRFTAAHTFKIVFYGGPEKTHLAYDGATRSELEVDRRFNPLTHPDEIDNFFQPHFELHDEWTLSDKLTLNNTLYIFRGDGYYDQWKEGRNLGEYFYNTPGADTLTADLLRRRNVAESDGGWIPRLTIEHKYGETILGGELRLHDARHEGTVNWASRLPEGAVPNQHYYDYKVNKQSFSGYVHNLFRVTDRLRAMVDLQAQSHTYKLHDDQLFDTRFEETYTSFNPRLGLNYRLLDAKENHWQPLTVIYANISWAQREPASKDIYNPQDYYRMPIITPIYFSNGVNGGEYTGPSLKPEKLTNIETGLHFQWMRARVGLNYYYMKLKDAIVTDNGQLDDLGNLLSANADEVLHKGIEIVGSYRPFGFLNLSANLALTDHSFVRYDEVDWNTSELTSRDGNRIGQDPEYLANAQAEFEYRDFFGGFAVRLVGKQYTDNSQNEQTAIESYTLCSLSTGYRLRNLPGGIPLLELRARVNNLFDTEYEAVGYGDTYIVGAPRSFYTTLAVEL